MTPGLRSSTSLLPTTAFPPLPYPPSFTPDTRPPRPSSRLFQGVACCRPRLLSSIARALLLDPASAKTRCVRIPRPVGFPPSRRSFNQYHLFIIFLACFDSPHAPPIFAEDASRQGPLDDNSIWDFCFFFLPPLQIIALSEGFW
jgi:hypothetical protein